VIAVASTMSVPPTYVESPFTAGTVLIVGYEPPLRLRWAERTPADCDS
jgi:hypothetical protein